MLEVRELSKSFGGLKAVDQAFARRPPRRDRRPDRAQRGGQDDAVRRHRGLPHRPDAGRVTFEGQDITGLAPHRICAAGMVRTFQITQPFAKISGAREHHGRRLLPHGQPRHGRARGRGGGGHRGHGGPARPDGGRAHHCRPQAARACPRPRDPASAAAAGRGDGGPQSLRNRRVDFADPVHSRFRRDAAAHRTRDAGGDGPGRTGLCPQQRAHHRGKERRRPSSPMLG